MWFSTLRRVDRPVLVAREFLASRGAEIEVRDVRANLEFVRELVEDLNSRATPTVVIGNGVIIGFDPEAYEAALHDAG